MVFKNFRVNVVVRILLLIVSITLFLILIKQPKYQVSGFLLLGIVIYLIYSLIRYVEQTNKKLTQFLESIRHSDFSTSFTEKGKGKSFEKLNHAFNQVIDEFKQTRAEKEEHFNYLQTVVQHVSIGIIAYRKDGKVDMVNNAAKRLLKMNNLRNVSELASFKEELPSLLLEMKAGDRQLIPLVIDNELLQLSVYATEFRMRQEEFVLISIQNIHPELEEKEIESWQKLIRVLTHEIMNSITPISSLAITVKDILVGEDGKTLCFNNIDNEDIENIHSALNTIESRSNGLLNFVETYRNLTRIPKPNFRYFEVRELLERSFQLLKPKTDELGIEIVSKVFPEDLKITADPDLLDQVIINLMVNSVDAVKDKANPKIWMMASSNKSGRITIEIADNGSGIKPDILDKIFMPFFTSKKHGSGIGLSLSRQIMHLHKGSITVKSIPDEGSVFTLTF